MPTQVTVAGKGISVSLLLWRHGRHRGQTAERLAQTLALNPELAALGPILPIGTVVLIPDLPPVLERARAAAPAVSLFD